MTADSRIPILQRPRQYEGEPEVGALREELLLLAQQVMDVEVSGVIGARRYERTPSRSKYGNGYRARRRDRRVGTIELEIRSYAGAAISRSHAGAATARGAGLVAVVQERTCMG